MKIDMSANTKGKVATLWCCIASQKSRAEVGEVRSKALSADEIAADILKASLSTSTPVDFAG